MVVAVNSDPVGSALEGWAAAVSDLGVKLVNGHLELRSRAVVRPLPSPTRPHHQPLSLLQLRFLFRVHLHVAVSLLFELERFAVGISTVVHPLLLLPGASLLLAALADFATLLCAPVLLAEVTEPPRLPSFRVCDCSSACSGPRPHLPALHWPDLELRRADGPRLPVQRAAAARGHRWCGPGRGASPAPPSV